MQFIGWPAFTLEELRYKVKGWLVYLPSHTSPAFYRPYLKLSEEEKDKVVADIVDEVFLPQYIGRKIHPLALFEPLKNRLQTYTRFLEDD